MDRTKVIAVPLAVILATGVITGEKGHIAETHPEPTVVLQVDGPGKLGVLSSASNPRSGSYSGDGIIRR